MRDLTMIISALAFFASVASAAPMPYTARQSAARRSVLPDSLFARSSFDPKPAPGNYQIYQIIGADEEKLSITFNGEGTTATVSRGFSPKSAWAIANKPDGTQSIAPVDSPDLEAAWGADAVSVMPAGNYEWNIRKTGSGYTIQDGSGKVFWGLSSLTDDAPVTLGRGTTDNMQIWQFGKI